MAKKIKNSQLNLTIDIIMFVVMMAVAGIGLMIKYVLIPGFKRNVIYGSDVELSFWGLDRHQWGSIHLSLSLILLFLLVLHIVFHWRMIVCIFKSMVSIKAIRILLTTALIIISVILCVIPLLIQPEITNAEPHHFHQSHHHAEPAIRDKDPAQGTELKQSVNKTSVKTDTNETIQVTQPYNIHEEKKHGNRELKDIEVYGYMTINELAKKYNIPTSELALYIHVPEIYINENLGRLRKKYDFHMDDLRVYIYSKSRQQNQNNITTKNL